MACIQQHFESVVAAMVSTNDDVYIPSRPHILHKSVKRYESRTFESDGPGGKAVNGPRHDNDKIRIRDIKILPTTDECFSLRAPWMPSKDIDFAHFLPHGYARNIDTHFRLLRHDSVEKIRDINYNATQQAFLADLDAIEICDQDFLETIVGNRYFLYHDVRVEAVIAGENNGVMLRMSFECPQQLRGRQMHKSTRLMKGMLCAILVLDRETNELSIHYFNVEMKHSTYSLATKNGHERRAAIELSLLPDATKQDVGSALSLAVGMRPNVSMALVEYPKILYAGFANILRCLQNMTDFDYAFGQYISPRPEAYENDSSELLVRPPSYSEQLDFGFDLSPLTEITTSRFSLDDLTGDKLPHALKHVEDNTSLDQGQAVALLSNLTSELSFTQGPPGCGKTYLGVALTRVLLASRPKGSEKPILVVCRTNHALDSFLAGLREANVDKLMRVGSGSKAEWTKSINLRAIAQENNYSPSEKTKRFRLNEMKDAAWVLLDAWCRDLSKELVTGIPCWQSIHPILRDHYPKIYAQLVTHTAQPAAFAFTYDYWARGGDIATIESLHRELIARLNASLKGGEKPEMSEQVIRSFLADIAAYAKAQSISAGSDDVWRLPLERRMELIRKWQSHLSKYQTLSQLQSIHEEHQELLSSTKSIRDARYIRSMLKQNVIGMTTTACASHWELLRTVGFDILICEEAAEVLEAHNLCCLLPSLRHAIHIGDPQQLRPNVEEQSLALENAQGKPFRLDESLFERVMKPIDHRVRRIPTSKLHIQRRMHPDIADISRVTYPFLQDHEATSLHPPPKGLQRRLWWIDHDIPEDTIDGVSKSVTNEYEVDFVKELVTYLLRGNDYNYGDIAILTPYSGQLLKLREALSAEFAVWLSDQDREALVEAGAIDADCEDLDEQKKLSVAVKDYIRLATIDNFQGEEAKILILSTVRSGGRLGFVKSANRINVACSRARDGFYVVGNANSLRADPKWKSVVDVFQAQHSIGRYVQLQCDRHPEHHVFAKSAQDIASFTACQILCNQALPCDHLCVEQCHDAILHKIMSCQQPCRKTLSCGHECQKSCTEPCGPCTEKVPRYLRSCGHTTLAICSAENIECDHFEGYYSPSCGKHNVGYTCGEPAKSSTCGELCAEQLCCGHYCEGICGSCEYEGKHSTCSRTCGKPLSCGHQCKLTCHKDIECPPCEQPAIPACCHEVTRRSCTERPTACLVPISATCPNGQTCEVTCCLTNNMSESPDSTQLLFSDETERLIQSVISTFLERSDILDAKLNHRAQILSRTLNLFLMQQVQSSTSAANNAVTAILHRTDETNSLRKAITTEQHYLNVFNTSLQILSTHYPGQTITSLNGLLKSRLHELELRATLIKARDTFAIVSHLAECEDQTRQMQRTADELAFFTRTELTASLEKTSENILLADVIEECRCILREFHISSVGTIDSPV